MNVIRRFAVVIACCVGGFGCASESNRDTLTKGMAMGKCIETLNRHGIRARQNNGDYASRTGCPLETYVIETAGSGDAVVVHFEQKAPGRDFEIESIYMYREWQTESRKPKKLRRYDKVDLPAVDADQLKKWIEGTGALGYPATQPVADQMRPGIWAWRGEPGKSDLEEILSSDDLHKFIGRQVVVCGQPYNVKVGVAAIRLLEHSILIRCETQLNPRTEPLPSAVWVTGKLFKWPDLSEYPGGIAFDFPWGAFEVEGE